MPLSTGRVLLSSVAIIWLSSVKDSGAEVEQIFASKSGTKLSVGIGSKSEGDWLVMLVGDDKADSIPESESESMEESFGSLAKERLSFHWACSVGALPWLHIPMSHDFALVSVSTAVSPSVMGAGLVIGLSLSEQLSLSVKWAAETVLHTFFLTGVPLIGSEA